MTAARPPPPPRVWLEPEGSLCGKAAGVCRRSAARPPAVLGLPWSRRLQARSSSPAGTTLVLHRTAACLVCARHTRERHPPADARDCETAHARRDAPAPDIFPRALLGKAPRSIAIQTPASA